LCRPSHSASVRLHTERCARELSAELNAAEAAEATSPLRLPPALFNVHIGNDISSQASSFVDNTFELRRVLRAFASVSKKDSDLRALGVGQGVGRAEGKAPEMGSGKRQDPSARVSDFG